MKKVSSVAGKNRAALVVAAIMLVLIFGIYGPGYDSASFIYEQF